MLQQAANGVVLGAIYALIALGYTMVYGVLRLINFAHGDIFMLGAFAGLFCSRALHITTGTPNPFLVLLVIAGSMLACALVGMFIERVAYRPLRKAPRLTLLITAIGVSMLLEYGGQVVFTPTTQGFPDLLPARAVIDTPTLTVTFVDVAILVAAIVLMVGLQLIVTRTKVGRAMRAVALDLPAASLMGINTDRIISFTFALGSALAAAGGVLSSVRQPAIDPLMGIKVGLTAFVAAVLGGIGSIPGAVLGGFLMGLVETGTTAVGKSDYKDAVVFAILIGVLLIRPSGLMGRTVAEKV